jgi:hypothetical protein
MSLKVMIKKFDTIGRKPGLKLNNSDRFQTVIGGMLSIIIYILLILSFLNFGQEFYYRQNPTVSNSNINSESPEIIGINGHNGIFSFVLFFLDIDGNYISPNLFLTQTEETSTQLNNNSNTTDNSIKHILNYTNIISQCNVNLISDRMKNIKSFAIYKNKISSGYCLESSSLISLDNYITNDIFYDKRLKIKLPKIENLNNTEVNSNSKIKKVEIIFTKARNNERNFNYPLSEEIGRKEFDLELNKKIELTLKREFLYTDTGYILEDFKMVNTVNIETFQQFYGNSKNYFEIEINLSGMNYILYRKYLKVQRLLAEVGGIMKAFVLIAFIMNYFDGKTRYYQTMISQLFDAEDLYRNFYYHSTNSIRPKYRDSIALKRTKIIDDFKKETSSNSTQKLNNFMHDFSMLKMSNKRLVDNPTIQEIKQKFEVDEFAKSNGQNIEESNKSTPKNNDNMFQNNKQNMTIQNMSFAHNCSNEVLITNQKLKKAKTFKTNFERVKTGKFLIRASDILCICFFCKNRKSIEKKAKILFAGQLLIDNRLDLVNILKKNLDFDRFKYLALKDHQLVMLNSLSKFLLDPEKLNLLEFNNITYEKFIDCLTHGHGSNNIIDHNLMEFVKTKFQIDSKMMEDDNE